jgi:hypothetical protein
MKKIVLLLAILLLLAPGLASAESGKELLENSTIFNDNRVTFSGEVLGILLRGDFAWVNISDNGYSIGVWCRASDAKKVSIIGDYKHLGDIVQVTGTFHMACVEHGGDLDIHADNLTVLAAGKELDKSVNLLFAALSVILVVVAFLITFHLWRVRKEREKILPWPFR